MACAVIVTGALDGDLIVDGAGLTAASIIAGFAVASAGGVTLLLGGRQEF